MFDARQLMSDAKFYESYSRFDELTGKYEDWHSSVKRVMNMHREYYADKMTPALAEMIDFAERAYEDKLILGAQRVLQFGGDQILKHQAKVYNCTSSYADRPAFFGEAMYLLLCGCGVGFSVQKHHVKRLPKIVSRKKSAKMFTVPDSIEGWSQAFDVLLSSFFGDGGKHPEYKGHPIYFDLSKIRPKGALISGGFKAPGPEPLRRALERVETILYRVADDARQMKPIEVYDIVMHMSDAVISGGVRRSATICLFSYDDEEMIKAKTGAWFSENPQRARSNNSAVILRDSISFEEFQKIMLSVQHSGEPGFIFTDNLEFTFNPCVTGDTMVKVRDHDVYENGELIAQGMVYEIPMVLLVEKFNNGERMPLVLSYNLETGEKQWDYITDAAMTRKDAKILKIMDETTGKIVRCTEDHLIFTKNRGYVKAKELLETDELLFD